MRALVIALAGRKASSGAGAELATGQTISAPDVIFEAAYVASQLLVD